MDLPELFARAGIQPEAADDLMKWARARTSVLLASLDAKTPLGQSLAPGLAQLVMRQGPESESDVVAVPPPPPLTSSEVPTPRRETTSRSSPRATARVISRPFLGAAVEAALSSNNLTLEPDEAPPPPPDAAQTELDEEASIGGFARFGVRRPPAEVDDDDERPPLSHGFALHAEREASQLTAVPAPPSFEASESGIRTNLQHITGDSERSTSLVVGIPDDEGADVPIPRARRVSGGLEATASGSLRAAAPPEKRAQELSIELNLQIEDPELSSALMRMIPANGETSTMLSASSAASSSLLRATPVVGEPSLQIPITIDDTMAPVGATDDDDDDDDETVALDEPEPETDLEPTIAIAPSPAKRRPPPPPPAKGVQAGAPATQPRSASQPTPAAGNNKRNRGRKKIVELSTPVVRPAPRPSAPEPAPVRVTREAPRQEHTPIPNYLRDDDE